MKYVIRVTPDDDPVSFWHVIDAPEIPSWWEDRQAHALWWDENVRPHVDGPSELEITRYANEDYDSETEDLDAIGIEWEFGVDDFR